MGLFRRSQELNGVDTTHHHTKRDALLTGAVAHHEANDHPTRDALLAGGAVGELQHHRNEKEIKREHENAALNSGTGMTGHHHLGSGNRTTGMGTTDPMLAGTGTGVGAAGMGTHTGPAPLAGVNSNHSGGSQSRPTVQQANKLQRKGKLESTMGGLLCSSSLKHKSATHLAQADHLRMQASELAHAEVLEQEAGMRRQRAVGLGADPVHASGMTGFGTNNRTAQVA